MSLTEQQAVKAIRIAGGCTLLGVAAGIAGSVVSGIGGLGGQEIPLLSASDAMTLAQRRTAYVAREWLFLFYAVLAVGQGVGLYLLTRGTGQLALWAGAAFFAGIGVGIVQDAAVVGFIAQFPIEYVAADGAVRAGLESQGRIALAMILAAQTIANLLLGVGVALFAAALLRRRNVSAAFGVAGCVAAAAAIFYGVVVATPPLAEYRAAAEQVFGLVVLWDLWAGVVMIGYREQPKPPRSEEPSRP